VLFCVSYVLRVTFTEYHTLALYDECRYAECHYTECHGAVFSLRNRLRPIHFMMQDPGLSVLPLTKSKNKLTSWFLAKPFQIRLTFADKATSISSMAAPVNCSIRVDSGLACKC
jgi:hypothetical protein